MVRTLRLQARWILEPNCRENAAQPRRIWSSCIPWYQCLGERRIKKQRRRKVSGEPDQLRESLRHVTLPRQRLAAASVRISRSWVKTPGVSDVRRVHRALRGQADPGLTAFGRSSRAPAGYEPRTEAIMQVNSYIRLGRPASLRVGSLAQSGCSSWTGC